MSSKIEWTDETWNPVRGCSIVSAGCTNCYAMKQAHRFSGPGGPYEGLTQLSNGGPVWNGEIQLVPELLARPLRWRRRRLVFVNSMSDLFHPNVPDEYIDRVFAVMAASPRHIFQILTKRADRMLRYINGLASGGEVDPERWDAARRPLWEAAGGISANLQEWIGVFLAHQMLPLPNVALGVSVENQATADERIPPLLDTPAAVRWISAEPLLGPIELNWISAVPYGGEEYRGIYINALTGGRKTESPWHLNWVVAGGESGPGARPMHPDWIRSIRDQCIDADVPFFFKQWGEWRPATAGELDAHEHNMNVCTVAEDHKKRRVYWPDGTFNGGSATKNGGVGWHLLRVGKKAGGRELDGEIWDQMPALLRH